MAIYFGKIGTTNMRLRSDVYATSQSNTGTVNLRSTVGPLTYYNENAGLGRWAAQTQGSTGSNKTIGYYQNLAGVGFAKFTGGSVTTGSGTDNDAYNNNTTWNYWGLGDSLMFTFNDYGNGYVGSFTGIKGFEGPSGRIYSLRQWAFNSTRTQLAIRLSYMNGTVPLQSHLDSIFFVSATSYPSGNTTSVASLTGASATFASYSAGAPVDYTGVWIWSGSIIEPTQWVGIRLT